MNRNLIGNSSRIPTKFNRRKESEIQVEIDKIQTPKVQEEVEQPSEIIQPTGEFFTLSHDDFGKELIAKSNEIFKGTGVEIPQKDSLENPLTGVVQKMNILKRAALTTTIYNNSLIFSNTWPITPLQSEQLIKEGKHPNTKNTFEDLALILYDRTGTNPQEAEAIYQSIKQNSNFSSSDLEKRMLIVHAGLEVDENMPNGVKPIVLPGLTRVYFPEVLNKQGNYKFEYGSDQGLPKISELGTGVRTLCMPNKIENLGLRILCQNITSCTLDVSSSSLENYVSSDITIFCRGEEK